MTPAVRYAAAARRFARADKVRDKKWIERYEAKPLMINGRGKGRKLRFRDE
jgi:hypothetical protein